MTLGKLLKHTLGAVRSGHGRNSSGHGYGSSLERVIADLETLNGSTEQDFLSVGGKLMEFLTTARQISSDMTALSELISGEGGRRATQVLGRVLERSRQTEARAEAGDRALASVCDAARGIGRTFGGFRDTVAVFRVLGSLTRIETARLGGTGAEFGSLAEEVNALTESIEASGRGIVDAATLLHQSMQSAIATVTGLRAGELLAMPSLIAEITTGIESLEERYRRAAEESLRQGAEYAEVSAAIEDLITAIQFHDITRQQIEHVAEALRRLRSKLQDEGGNGGAAAFDAGAVLALETSQLTNTEQVFASAVGRMERDLDRIADRVGHMAEESQTLMGSSADEQNSFFLQLEGRFTAILKILGSCAQAEAKTLASLAELRETVARMRESVAEVSQIEIRIHRIAINATIRAIQIGDAGNALQVLAEVMQRLALDSSRITNEVTGALDTIIAAAGRLSGGAGSISASTNSEADQVLSEMRTTILELHSSSESSFSRLTQIAALSLRLSDGVRSVRAGFSAGKIFAEAIERARGALEEMGGEAGRTHPGGGKVAGEPRLEDFATHYTMQAEREVHETVATGAAVDRAAADTAPTVVADEENLGDNVELF